MGEERYAMRKTSEDQTTHIKDSASLERALAKTDAGPRVILYGNGTRQKADPTTFLQYPRDIATHRDVVFVFGDNVEANDNFHNQWQGQLGPDWQKTFDACKSGLGFQHDFTPIRQGGGGQARDMLAHASFALPPDADPRIHANWIYVSEENISAAREAGYIVETASTYPPNIIGVPICMDTGPVEQRSNVIILAIAATFDELEAHLKNGRTVVIPAFRDGSVSIGGGLATGRMGHDEAGVNAYLQHRVAQLQKLATELQKTWQEKADKAEVNFSSIEENYIQQRVQLAERSAAQRIAAPVVEVEQEEVEVAPPVRTDRVREEELGLLDDDELPATSSEQAIPVFEGGLHRDDLGRPAYQDLDDILALHATDMAPELLQALQQLRGKVVQTDFIARRALGQLEDAAAFRREAEERYQAVEVSTATSFTVNFDREQKLSTLEQRGKSYQYATATANPRESGAQDRHVSPIAVIGYAMSNSLEPDTDVMTFIKLTLDKLDFYVTPTDPEQIQASFKETVIYDEEHLRRSQRKTKRSADSSSAFTDQEDTIQAWYDRFKNTKEYQENYSWMQGEELATKCFELYNRRQEAIMLSTNAKKGIVNPTPDTQSGPGKKDEGNVVREAIKVLAVAEWKVTNFEYDSPEAAQAAIKQSAKLANPDARGKERIKNIRGKFLLSEPELKEVVDSIHSVFDYRPFPQGAARVEKPDKEVDVARTRYTDEPPERLYRLAADHLAMMFVLCPNLQERHQQTIMKGFLDRVAQDYEREGYASKPTWAALVGEDGKINGDKLYDAVFNELTIRYPYHHYSDPKQTEEELVNDYFESLTNSCAYMERQLGLYERLAKGEQVADEEFDVTLRRTEVSEPAAEDLEEVDMGGEYDLNDEEDLDEEAGVDVEEEFYDGGDLNEEDGVDVEEDDADDVMELDRPTAPSQPALFDEEEEDSSLDSSYEQSEESYDSDEEADRSIFNRATPSIISVELTKQKFASLSDAFKAACIEFQSATDIDQKGEAVRKLLVINNTLEESLRGLEEEAKQRMAARPVDDEEQADGLHTGSAEDLSRSSSDLGLEPQSKRLRQKRDFTDEHEIEKNKHLRKKDDEDPDDPGFGGSPKHQSSVEASSNTAGVKKRSYDTSLATDGGGGQSNQDKQSDEMEYDTSADMQPRPAKKIKLEPDGSKSSTPLASESVSVTHSAARKHGASVFEKAVCKKAQEIASTTSLVSVVDHSPKL